MKKLAIIFIGLLLIAFSIDANAQDPKESAMSVSSATIIEPLGIVNQSHLLFGNIIAGTENGSVTVYSDGSETLYTGVAAPTGFVGQVQPATFLVSGAIGATYSIEVPGDVTLTDPVSSETMTVNAFETDLGLQSTLTELSELMTVGATLNVTAGQPAGTYTGTFEIKVQYE